MTQAPTPDIVIIGNGITGITAARTVRKLCPEARIRIISKETQYFFSRTALMYVYMGHMRFQDTMPYETHFWEKNRLELLHDNVTNLDTTARTLQLEQAGELKYDVLLIATGAAPNKFGWPGQDLPRVQGLYSYQDLEALEHSTADGCKRGVIVGGGLIGIEFAEMLHTRNIPVTLLVREKNYWDNVLPLEEAQMINAEIREHHIDLQLQTELKEIKANDRGEAGSVVTSKDETIECDVVGLTAGVHPNIALLKNNDTGIETKRGVLVDRYLRTNVPDVFAAGDCAEFREGEKSGPPVEQLWYTGRMHGEVAGRLMAKRAYEIAGNTKAEAIETPAYDRGIWFNSAKFFTIEYQTYGFVPNRFPENNTYVWKDDARKQLLRLVWEETGGERLFTGINLLGIRMRQDVCETWIRDGRSVDYVVDHLKEAWFDPEFFAPVYKRVQKHYRSVVAAPA